MPNTKRIHSVEQAIEWSYRQGFTGAKLAADDYTNATDSAFVLYDLGTYGDTIKFFDSPEDANKALQTVAYPGQLRKPE